MLQYTFVIENFIKNSYGSQRFAFIQFAIFEDLLRPLTISTDIIVRQCLQCIQKLLSLPVKWPSPDTFPLLVLSYLVPYGDIDTINTWSFPLGNYQLMTG